MTSLFESEWLDRQDELDAAMDEDLLLEPRARPALPQVQDASGRFVVDVNAETVPDTARPPVPFRGIFTTHGSMSHAHGRSMADSTTRPISSEAPMIDVAMAVLGTGLAEEDRITRPKTGERFRIARIIRVEFQRAHLMLAEIR